VSSLPKAVTWKRTGRDSNPRPFEGSRANALPLSHTGHHILNSNILNCVCLLPGNLHFNATSREYNREVVDLIEPFLYEYVSERRGSISAEHGIGFSKRKYMHYSRNAPAIELMRRMKQVLDPHGILNPYKTIPSVAAN